MGKKEDLKRRLKQSARRRARRPTPQPDPHHDTAKQACYDLIAAVSIKHFQDDPDLLDRNLEQALRDLPPGRTCEQPASEKLRSEIAATVAEKNFPAEHVRATANQLLKDIRRQRDFDNRPTAFLEFLSTVCR